MINRRTREFPKEDIQKIAGTYHNWRNPDRDYDDVLTPGRYVGLPEKEGDFDFEEG